MSYDAVKVFTATKAKEREALGEVMTAWLRRMEGEVEVVDTKVIQSSDQQFHCLTIVVFYRRA
jgi:uncharacterized protein YicC (UPF0701 family)